MRACFLLFIAAAGAISPPPASAGGTITADFTATSLVLVPVHVNGKGPYRFVVDTGATTTTLDDELATQLGLGVTGVMEVVTSAGMFRAPVGTLNELSIGTARVSPLRVGWMPLDELRLDDGRIAGVIGQDVLRSRTLTIDYARRRVELTVGPCTTEGATLEVEWSEERPVVSVGVRARGLPSTARLVLDSAANTLVLFATPRSGAALTSVSAHGGTIAAEAIPRAELEVEGTPREGPAVLLMPTAPRQEAGLLPTAWFSCVCIDGPRSRATLSRITSRARR